MILICLHRSLYEVLPLKLVVLKNWQKLALQVVRSNSPPVQKLYIDIAVDITFSRAGTGDRSAQQSAASYWQQKTSKNTFTVRTNLTLNLGDAIGEIAKPLIHEETA